MTATNTFQIDISVPCYYSFFVERPADITQDALLASITPDDLNDGEMRDNTDYLQDAWSLDAVSTIECLDADGDYQQAF